MIPMVLSVTSHVYDAQSAVLRQITGLVVCQACRLDWEYETFHPNPKVAIFADGPVPGL